LDSQILVKVECYRVGEIAGRASGLVVVDE
jgi:hypothetical protein